MNVQAIIFTKYGATFLDVSSFRLTFFGCSRKHIFFKQSHFCTSQVYLLKQVGQRQRQRQIQRQRHVSGFISWSRVGKLSSWRTPLFAGNASASLRTFFPPFISALAITSQLSRLLFGSNLNWNIRPPGFFCNLLDLGFDAPEVYSTKINWGLNCLKISELEHFVEYRFWLIRREKGNCYESLLSHAPISPLWTDQDWHWAKPRLAKLPAFSILSAKLTANHKLWLKLWLDNKICKKLTLNHTGIRVQPKYLAEIKIQ